MKNKKDMNNSIISNQEEKNMTITYCQKKVDPIEKSFPTSDFFIVGSWILLTLIVYFFIFQRFLKQKAIGKARFFVSYLIFSLLVVLILVGKKYIPTDYYANIITEIIGIALTVFIIDRVYYFLSKRSEKIHRDISLRNCKMPIYFYCCIWFTIYEPNQLVRKSKLQKYQDLEKFFMSDDFYNSVCSFNFAKLISSNKTYAQFYAEKLNQAEENFQNILAKYASKLTLEDIRRLEFFGGGSYLTKVFISMDLCRTDRKSSQDNSNIDTPMNYFSMVSKNNFQKHFNKLLELISDFNAVSNSDEQWTINTLSPRGLYRESNEDSYDW